MPVRGRSKAFADRHSRWRKNWPYLLLAFFLVIVSIFAIAIARPLRKWFRRQMIARRARHSGQGVPPYLEPSAPATFISSSGQKRQYSDALWPQTLYGHGDTWSGDRTSSSRRSESSYVSSGGLGSYSEVGTPKDPTPLPNPPPGPGIRTLFVTQVAGSGKLSTRQETWELKMREQHQETPGWFQRKLASWKSFGSRVGAKEYSVVNSDISRAV